MPFPERPAQGVVGAEAVAVSVSKVELAGSEQLAAVVSTTSSAEDVEADAQPLFDAEHRALGRGDEASGRGVPVRIDQEIQGRDLASRGFTESDESARDDA